MSDTKAVTTWPNVEGMDELVELALNLHWCWNHASDEIWKSLDAELWQSTQNPWIILLTVSREKIASLLATPDFRQRLQDCQRHNHKSFHEEGWFQKKYPEAGLSLVAYFSMEFMVDRGVAHLFRRPWQCSRRSDEGSEQFGGAHCRYRLALWAGIFPPGF